jgi:hypothetical protein
MSYLREYFKELCKILGWVGAGYMIGNAGFFDPLAVYLCLVALFVATAGPITLSMKKDGTK